MATTPTTTTLSITTFVQAKDATQIIIAKVTIALEDTVLMWST